MVHFMLRNRLIGQADNKVSHTSNRKLSRTYMQRLSLLFAELKKIGNENTMKEQSGKTGKNSIKSCSTCQQNAGYVARNEKCLLCCHGKCPIR